MRRATSVLLCLLLSGCAAERPRTIAFPGVAPRAIARADQVGSYGDAAANIAAVFERDLGFAPFTATLRFYPDRAGFEAALLESGYDAALAHRAARVMAAIGGARTVLIKAESLVPLSWPERLALLAHELTHTFQYELCQGRRGASDQWLREGFAEWVSIRVLERMHGISADEYRTRKLAELRATDRRQAPRLGDMATFPQFVALAERTGRAPYVQSFVAVDLLIERHGVPRVIRYFELFAASDDRGGNFRAAFGEDLAAFEAFVIGRVWR
jgi:hypothetical protein